MNLREINIALAIIGLFFIQSMNAQNASCTIEVSLDTIYMGNYFEIAYVEENTKGEFPQLNFENFDVVSGPNRMASTTIINGAVTSSKRSSYRLMPLKSGEFLLPSFTVFDNEGNPIPMVETKVVVLENPEGIKQHHALDEWKNDLMLTPRLFDKKPKTDKQKKKKKRKLIRI